MSDDISCQDQFWLAAKEGDVGSAIAAIQRQAAETSGAADDTTLSIVDSFSQLASAKDSHGLTALMLAVRALQTGFVAFLLGAEGGSDAAFPNVLPASVRVALVNCEDPTGDTALDFACRLHSPPQQRSEAVGERSEGDGGADVDTAASPSVAITKLLLGVAGDAIINLKGRPTNGTGTDYATPLTPTRRTKGPLDPIFAAVQSDDYDLVALLIERGADLTVVTNSPFGPLVNASPFVASLVLNRNRALKAFIDSGVFSGGGGGGGGGAPPAPAAAADSTTGGSAVSAPSPSLPPRHSALDVISRRLNAEGLAIILDAGLDPAELIALDEQRVLQVFRREEVLAKEGIVPIKPAEGAAEDEGAR